MTRAFDSRVGAAIAQMRADAARLQSSAAAFDELVAPFAREGATPVFHSARSGSHGVELNVAACNRDQCGAPAPCSVSPPNSDLHLRIHVSFFNNLAETITGGKRLSDEFLMKYARVLHAELPLPLMVHSRAPRWAITAAKQRPIELRTAAQPDRVLLLLRIDRLEIDGQKFDAPTAATIHYDLKQDAFGEYRLERHGGIELETELPDNPRAFLLEKLAAFFGPVLDFGGVIIPDGGLPGALKGLQSQGIHAQDEWIVAAWNVPATVIDEVSRILRNNRATAQAR
jgi:hypothetical protein